MIDDIEKKIVEKLSGLPIERFVEFDKWNRDGNRLGKATNGHGIVVYDYEWCFEIYCELLETLNSEGLNTLKKMSDIHREQGKKSDTAHDVLYHTIDKYIISIIHSYYPSI